MNRTLKCFWAVVILFLVFCIVDCKKLNDNGAKVTTFEPYNITGTSAVSGGNVISLDGSFILMKGICWSTRSNPTTDDYYTENGSGAGDFTAEMTGLLLDNNYYVRAYAVTANGTTYGEQKSFATMDGKPGICTSEITSVTNWSAVGGGTIISNGGLESTQYGLCWSTSPNPSILDNQILYDYSGANTFISSIENLNANTLYYVRAYATNSHFTVYGNEVSFTTLSNESFNGHDCVDLGLPSGNLWATCNVGATCIDDLGDYFAWGETQPKTIYTWSTYIHCMGDYNQLTKYCNDAEYGYNGFVDGILYLRAVDDAATANWGIGWRVPTSGEWDELFNKTTHIWGTLNGKSGMRLVGPNGNCVFLPNTISFIPEYMSNSIDPNSPYCARYYGVDHDCTSVGWNPRAKGCSVRPIHPNVR